MANLTSSQGDEPVMALPSVATGLARVLTGNQQPVRRRISVLRTRLFADNQVDRGQGA
jgi:hypothetical protein